MIELQNDFKKTLDLGCGLRPKNPFNADMIFGIDVREDAPNNIISADLTIQNIPFEREEFDFVTAFDFIEHIPRVIYKPERRNSFVELMNEIYRVLKFDGIFLSSTPCYPGGAAFRDPTHVNFITEETFPLYFGDAYVAEQYCWASMYGFNGSFKVLNQFMQGASLISVMKKVKPIPKGDNKSNQDALNDLLYDAINLVKLNKNEDAIKLFWDAHQMDPTYIKPLYEMSKLHFHYNNFLEVIRICEGINKIDSLFVDAYTLSAQAMIKSGDFNGASKMIQKTLNINPEDDVALKLLNEVTAK